MKGDTIPKFMVMVKGFFYSIAAESIESLFELVILVSASGDGGSLRRLIVTWYLGASSKYNPAGI